MWDHTRVIPQLPATRFDQHLREVLVGIGSNHITIERDGTARAMTLSEATDWLDLLENEQRNQFHRCRALRQQTSQS